ncbi:MAG: alpha/beta fold hydrolase [Polyangiaceae bacterium]|nr:alpha/beta fold hydrolase [Polyangiaceae bacterium]
MKNDDRRADAALPPALTGPSFVLDDARVGRLWCYGGEGRGVPLVLVHSVNAAASAFEVRPLYEHYASARPTYAFDLPGFGLSERSARAYTPRLMTDALLAVVREVRRRHGGAPVDALALSLSCEFLARAAVEEPGAFRTLALVSPTGFSGPPRPPGPPGSTRAMPGLLALVNGPRVGSTLFGLLTRPGVIRYFLERTWGSREIDEGLWAYDVQAARAPGAEHAPLYFLTGHLFSKDVMRLYGALEHPVWMSHGVRGDFVDYRGEAAVRGRANWSFDVFETGALPHFEVRARFVSAYGAFLAEAARGPGGG